MVNIPVSEHLHGDCHECLPISIAFVLDLLLQAASSIVRAMLLSIRRQHYIFTNFSVADLVTCLRLWLPHGSTACPCVARKKSGKIGNDRQGKTPQDTLHDTPNKIARHVCPRASCAAAASPMHTRSNSGRASQNPAR